MIQRFRNQTPITALPEEPILLLRIYRTCEAPVAPVEVDFRRLLEVAEHNRSVAGQPTREWFTDVVNEGIDLAEN